MEHTLRPFTAGDIADAAALLAARITRAGDAIARPGAQAIEAAIGALAACEGAAGVVARVQGEAVGYLLGRPVLAELDPVEAADYPPGSFVIPQEGHALAGSGGAELVRRLYAALAGGLVGRGLLHHQVTLPVHDRAVVGGWFSLGFGGEETGALRRVTALRAPAIDAEIRRVGPAAIDEVEALADELNRHLEQSPAFFPTAPAGADAWRALILEKLADPAHAFFVAYRDKKPVGMATFMDPWAFSPVFRPASLVYLDQGVVYPDERGHGTGRALVAAGLRWAAAQGYEWCGLHWVSANLLAGRFWPSLGFRPLEYRLVRQVDVRILDRR